MAKRTNTTQAAQTTGATVGYEAELWRMADALREQQAEPEKLNAAIDANLRGVVSQTAHHAA